MQSPLNVRKLSNSAAPISGDIPGVVHPPVALHYTFKDTCGSACEHFFGLTPKCASAASFCQPPEGVAVDFSHATGYERQASGFLSAEVGSFLVVVPLLALSDRRASSFYFIISHTFALPRTTEYVQGFSSILELLSLLAIHFREVFHL